MNYLKRGRQFEIRWFWENFLIGQIRCLNVFEYIFFEIIFLLRMGVKLLLVKDLAGKHGRTSWILFVFLLSFLLLQRGKLYFEFFYLPYYGETKKFRKEFWYQNFSIFCSSREVLTCGWESLKIFVLVLDLKWKRRVDLQHKKILYIFQFFSFANLLVFWDQKIYILAQILIKLKLQQKNWLINF